MGAILDLIIVGIIGTTVFLSIKRGFIKTALGALGFLLALVIALIFTSSLAESLQSGSVGDGLTPVMESVIDEVISEHSLEDVGRDDKDGPVKKLCSLLGAEDKAEKLQEDCKALKDKGLEAVRNRVKDALTKAGVALCCRILAFLLLFFGSRVVLKIVEIVLDKIVELPALRKANRILGGLAGLLLALFRVYMFCVAMRLLLPLLGDFGVRVASSGSVLYSLFSSTNFLVPGL